MPESVIKCNLNEALLLSNSIIETADVVCNLYEMNLYDFLLESKIIHD